MIDQVYMEATAAASPECAPSGNVPGNTVLVHNSYWFDKTYGGLVTSLAKAKESWYESQGIHVYSDAIYQQDLAAYQGPRGIGPDTRTPEQRALDADIVYGKEHPELPPPMGSILLRQNNGSLLGALWGATQIAAPDLAAAWAGLKMPAAAEQTLGNVRRGAGPFLTDEGPLSRVAANAARADMATEDRAELDPHDRSFYTAPHANSLDSLVPTQGYTLRTRSTGEILKFGETTLGTQRYSQRYLDEIGARMFFEAEGSKAEMRAWQTQKILEYKAANGGVRPLLNKTDY